MYVTYYKKIKINLGRFVKEKKNLVLFYNNIFFFAIFKNAFFFTEMIMLPLIKD